MGQVERVIDSQRRLFIFVTLVALKVPLVVSTLHFFAFLFSALSIRSAALAAAMR